VNSFIISSFLITFTFSCSKFKFVFSLPDFAAFQFRLFVCLVFKDFLQAYCHFAVETLHPPSSVEIRLVKTADLVLLYEWHHCQNLEIIVIKTPTAPQAKERRIQIAEKC
jgi:hypothetical protein